MQWIEEEIAKVEQEVYGGEMPVENKQVMRSILKKNAVHWERESVREDSNNSPVEGYFNKE